MSTTDWIDWIFGASLRARLVSVIRCPRTWRNTTSHPHTSNDGIPATSRVTSTRTLRIPWCGWEPLERKTWNENAKTKHQSSGFGAQEDRHRRQTPTSWSWIPKWRSRWARRCLAWRLGPRACRTLATSITDREGRTMVLSRRAVLDRFLRVTLSPFSGAQKTRSSVNIVARPNGKAK